MGCPPPIKRRCTAGAEDEDFAGKLRAFDAARMVHLRAREATKDMIIINDDVLLSTSYVQVNNNDDFIELLFSVFAFRKGRGFDFRSGGQTDRPSLSSLTLKAHGISNQRAALSHGAEALLLFAPKIETVQYNRGLV